MTLEDVEGSFFAGLCPNSAELDMKGMTLHCCLEDLSHNFPMTATVTKGSFCLSSCEVNQCKKSLQKGKLWTLMSPLLGVPRQA